MLRLCVVLAAAAFALADECAKFSSFNIQVLGKTKMKKGYVVDSLEKTLSQYQMSVIQEIRDASGTAFPQLFMDLVEAYPDLAEKLEYFEGPRLGRTNSKEQYGFIYNTDVFEKITHETYPDDGDKFEREPEIGLFKWKGCDIPFLVIICHVTPQDVPGEIDLLLDVYEYAKAKYETEDAIITGDMNAGCSYLNKGERADSKLLHDDRFISLFGDDTDSTVATSACPYDRMFITGDKLKDAVQLDTAKIYRFDTEQGLTNSVAKKVSDHYPVEVQFCCSAK